MIWIIGYLVLTIEGLIGLYACHQEPHGVRNGWLNLWRQLCHEHVRLPRAHLTHGRDTDICERIRFGFLNKN